MVTDLADHSEQKLHKILHNLTVSLPKLTNPSIHLLGPYSVQSVGAAYWTQYWIGCHSDTVYQHAGTHFCRPRKDYRQSQLHLISIQQLSGIWTQDLKPTTLTIKPTPGILAAWGIEGSASHRNGSYSQIFLRQESDPEAAILINHQARHQSQLPCPSWLLTELSIQTHWVWVEHRFLPLFKQRLLVQI